MSNVTVTVAGFTDHVLGTTGNDSINVSTAAANSIPLYGSQPALTGEIVLARAGVDTVIGTSRGDIVVDINGAGTISGGGGNDTIEVFGSGNTISGGDGNDTIISHNGGNLLIGGEGSNTYRVAPGDTVLAGNSVTAPASLAGGSIDGLPLVSKVVYGTSYVDGAVSVTNTLTGGVGSGDGKVTWFRADGSEIGFATYTDTRAFTTSVPKTIELKPNTTITGATTEDAADSITINVMNSLTDDGRDLAAFGVQAWDVQFFSAFAVHGDISLIRDRDAQTEGFVGFNTSIAYKPDADFSGVDTIYFRPIDGGGVVGDFQQVIVNVAAVPDAPVITSTPVTVAAGVTSTIPLTSIATDADTGDTLTLVGTPTVVGGSTNGTASYENGQLVFTPAAGFEGQETVSVSVSDGMTTVTGNVTITVPNSPPVITPTPVATLENVPVTIDLLSFVSDVNPTDGESVIGTPTATNGTLVDLGNGSYRLTPTSGFTGNAAISFVAGDGTDTVAGTINVSVVDDPAPIISSTPVTVAAGGGASTIPLTSVATDPNPGDTLTAVGAPTVVGGSTNGTASYVNGQLVFTPTAGFEGQETIRISVSDGSETVTGNVIITVPNAPPVITPTPVFTAEDDPVTINLLSFVSDVNPTDGESVIGTPTATNGTLVDLGNGNFRLTPTNGFTGNAAISFVAGDGTDTVAGTINVTVFNPPPEPTAPGTVAGGVGEAVTLNPLSGITDQSTVGGGGAGETVSIVGTTSTVAGGQVAPDIPFGSVSVNATGGLTVTPDSTFSGFQLGGFQVSDGTSTEADLISVATGVTFPSGRDGIVTGTSGNDTINVSYRENPSAGVEAQDVIDNQDNLFTFPSSLALGSNVIPQYDAVMGLGGNDFIEGNIGGGVYLGGSGNDSIRLNARGRESVDGGSDRDYIYRVGVHDTVNGGSSGDDVDTLAIKGLRTSTPAASVAFADGSNNEDGTITFLDGSGASVGTALFFDIENIVCFTPGTLIATPQGNVPVETLGVGSKVLTRDNGVQEIRWLGSKHLSGAQVVHTPKLRPVVIKAGSLGNNLPERDISLSPSHRVLMANQRASLYFGEPEVLVPAKHLVGSAGISRAESAPVTYIHFMFDQHEVVKSNGAWTESFQPGDYSLKGLSEEQRREIFTLFPELASSEGVEGYKAARLSLDKREARLLWNT